MNYVTLDETIRTAQSTLKDVDSAPILVWRQWVAMLCMPELGVSDENVKIITLYPVDFMVDKPDDMKALIDVAMYDANGCYLRHKFQKGGERIYPDDRLWPTAVVGTDTSQSLNSLIPVDISEDAFKFHLGTNGDKVYSIIVRYYVSPVDENGLPLIRQDETLAVVYFLHHLWAIRQNENQSEIEAKEMRWKIQADRVRASKKMRGVSNESMKTLVQSIWMRAIPSFSFSNY